MSNDEEAMEELRTQLQALWERCEDLEYRLGNLERSEGVDWSER